MGYRLARNWRAPGLEGGPILPVPATLVPPSGSRVDARRVARAPWDPPEQMRQMASLLNPARPPGDARGGSGGVFGQVLNVTGGPVHPV